MSSQSSQTSLKPLLSRRWNFRVFFSLFQNPRKHARDLIIQLSPDITAQHFKCEKSLLTYELVFAAEFFFKAIACHLKKFVLLKHL